MERSRYQRGFVFLRGKHVKTWCGRFTEDQFVDGQIKRVQRSVGLGSLKKFPTKRSAEKYLYKEYILPMQTGAYRPKNKITFGDFSARFERDILPLKKPAGRASTKSDIKILKQWFENIEMSSINSEMLQRWIAGRNEWAPKTVTNKLATLQRLWKQAKSWGYVSGDSPFEGLHLPEAELKEPTLLPPAQVQQVISMVEEPYQTMFWVLAETGMRGGEVCGLYKSDINMDICWIFIKRSAFQGKLQTPKTNKAVRAFAISELLRDHLREYIKASPETELLFFDKNGKAFDNGNVCKRVFKPVLKKLGIDGPRIGLHSFRHANASGMDSINVPMQVRQDRLGHASEKMTMRYTHSNSEDHRRVADALGAMFAPSSSASKSSQVDGVHNLPMSTEKRGEPSSLRPANDDTREISPSLPADSHPETALAMGAD